MRAIVWTRYGPPDVLQLQDVAKPDPKANELLIKIQATTVTAGDCELRGLHFSPWFGLLVRMFMGLTKPRRKILGQEFAGEVESVGNEVTLFRKGDQVFGTTGFGFGAYAEYISLPQKSKGGAVTKKPANMTYEEAAGVPTGGLEALSFLQRAGDLSGQKILIIGAAGGIGTFAVQIAHYYGANVTGVDSTEKLDLLRSIGANRVIDYTQEAAIKPGETYHVIFDVVGKSSFPECVAALGENGRYLLGNPRPSSMIRGLWTSMKGRKKVIWGASRQRIEDLEFLRSLIEAGKIKSVIDRRFPLDQTPEAHKYFESGIARGKIVITV